MSVSRKATLKLTERELWLLKCGFDSSFVDDGSDDGGAELSAISGKISLAWAKARKMMEEVEGKSE